MEAAKTTWVSGIDEQLAAVDIYGIKDTEIKNNLVSQISGVTNDLLKGILNGQNAQQRLSFLNDIVANGPPNGEAIRARLNDAMGDMALDLDQLSDNARKSAQQALEGQLPGSGDIEYVVDGVKRTLDGQSVQEARGVMDQLSRMVTGSDLLGLFDLGAEAAVWGSLLSEAIDSGIGGVVDLLTKEDQVNDPSVAVAATEKALPNAMRSGDVTLIDQLLNTLGVARARNQMPDLCAQILQYYRLAPPTDIDLSQRYGQLTRLLTRIDPLWVQGDDRVDSQLVNFRQLSNDAKRVLIDNPGSSYVTEGLLSQAYQRERSVRQQLKQDFPFAAL